MYADLARSVRIPGDWGLEIGMLFEVYRNTAAGRVCRVRVFACRPACGSTVPGVRAGRFAASRAGVVLAGDGGMGAFRGIPDATDCRDARIGAGFAAE